MGVHAEAFLYDEKMPPTEDAHDVLQAATRIDVPELPRFHHRGDNGKRGITPWIYPPLWMRRASHVGRGRLSARGIDWSKFVRINFTWSVALTLSSSRLSATAVLYFIEQGLMPKTGETFRVESASLQGDHSRR